MGEERKGRGQARGDEGDENEEAKVQCQSLRIRVRQRVHSSTCQRVHRRVSQRVCVCAQVVKSVHKSVLSVRADAHGSTHMRRAPVRILRVQLRSHLGNMLVCALPQTLIERRQDGYRDGDRDGEREAWKDIARGSKLLQQSRRSWRRGTAEPPRQARRTWCPRSGG
eukprot:2822013-Rhodomonas_salina.1